MANAAACGHALAIAGENHRTGSEAVLVFEFAFENVGDDFHVAMRVRGKSSVGRDPIFVDDAQRAKSNPLRIPVVAEAKGVMGFEPAVVSSTTFLGRTNANHSHSPLTYEVLLVIN